MSAYISLSIEASSGCYILLWWLDHIAAQSLLAAQTCIVPSPPWSTLPWAAGCRCPHRSPWAGSPSSWSGRWPWAPSWAPARTPPGSWPCPRWCTSPLGSPPRCSCTGSGWAGTLGPPRTAPPHCYSPQCHTPLGAPSQNCLTLTQLFSLHPTYLLALLSWFGHRHLDTDLKIDQWEASISFNWPITGQYYHFNLIQTSFAPGLATWRHCCLGTWLHFCLGTYSQWGSVFLP